MKAKIKPPTIINGPHRGEPIGHLIAWDGHLVSIWSDNAFDLVNAMTEAIGPVPQPPSLGLGGSVEVIGSISPFDKTPPQVVYNPSGDVQNQVLIGMFQAQVQAWNTRASLVTQAILSLIQRDKK